MALGAINIDTGAIGNLFGKIVDKIFPDKTEAEKVKAQMMQFQMTGNLEELKTILAPFLAEAQSADKWTSRARPSYLYVMYILILWAIPMAVISVISPNTATQMAAGAKAWLSAIPDYLWGVFGASFAVYNIARSYDKGKTVAG